MTQIALTVNGQSIKADVAPQAHSGLKMRSSACVGARADRDDHGGHDR